MDPSPRPTRVGWGLPDVVLVYLAGLVAATVALVSAAAATGLESGDDFTSGVLVVGFAAQLAAQVLVLGLVSRAKGRGSFAADFGLAIDRRDWWAIPLGIGLQIGLGILLLPIVELAGNEEQAVVEDLQDAGGLAVVGLALFAAVLAPVVEELVFRGLLLRALLRRTTAVGAVVISSLVFGLVHLVGDPSIGSLAVVPGLVGVGMVAAVLAVRSGSLSQPILLHVGFNLLTTMYALFG